jgi:pseudouridine synthase
MHERLQKFLARAGVASRRAAEELIGAGRVAVNGQVVRRMGVKVDPAADEVRVDTEVVRAPPAPAPLPLPGKEARAAAADPVGTGPRGPLPGRVYLVMNKPLGFLCTVSDDRGRRTVMDLLPRIRERVFPVGRLDEDSEGLLLLTNDGDLTNLLTHPRYEVPKTYDLRVRGEITPEEVIKVERGVWLSEGRTSQARLRIRRRGRDISHVELTLREGRNREVRRIFARLRHPVLSLRRVRLGPLELAALRPGQVRRLSPGEVAALYRAALSGGGGPGPEARPHARPRRGVPKGGTRPRRPSPRGDSPPRRPGPKGDSALRRPGPKGDSPVRRPGPKADSAHRRPSKGGARRRPPAGHAGRRGKGPPR